jgi:sodium/proline symporter
MAPLALFSYFFLVFIVGYVSVKNHMTQKDFIIGSRSLNFWLTALAAHASDMSSWLFLAYPAAIFLSGMSQIYTALGLIVFMWLNWEFIAHKLRTQTEHLSCQTLSLFFEKSLNDSSGKIALFTAFMSLIFYTIYIASGIYGIGLLSETLFHIPYLYGCLIGLLIIIPYVFFGGYITLAWIDLFQGLFLMIVICLIPAVYLIKMPTLSLDLTFTSSMSASIMLFFGWGLGYFGQPHIITKFMGIKHPQQIKRSKLVGMSWMIISLFAATMIGLIGKAFFAQNLNDPQTLFIQLVSSAFNPFLSYFMLCAVIAATINATSSQLLVLASSLTEDVYHRFINPQASSNTLLKTSRSAVIAVGLISFCIAFFKLSTIYNLVLYAWSGLGASFGPLVLYCLYAKKPKLKPAWAALISGALCSTCWPLVAHVFQLPNEPLLPSFVIALTLLGGTHYFLKEC